MALNLGVLTFQVRANLAGFDKSMQGIAATVAKNTIGFQAATVAAGAMGAALVGVGAAAVSIAAGFEQGLARVQAVSGATEEQLDSMSAAALRVAAATKFTARESADAMGLLAQAGFDADQIIAALPGTMELAAAGMVSVGDAAGIAVATLRGMGLEISELGRVNDVLVKSSASSNVNVLQLGESLKTVAPVAASAGISLEETVAVLGLLGDAGIQASMAGTTLRGAIARLLSPSNQVTEALDRLGVTATDSQGDLIPFADVIEQLGDAGAKTGDLMTIFGLKAGPGVAALVSRGADALRDMEDSLRDAGGTAESIANTQMATLTGQLLIMSSKIEGVAISFGNVLLPAVKLVVGGLQSALDVVQSLSPEFKQAAVVVAGVAAAMTGLFAATGTVLLALPLLPPLFSAIGTTAALAFGPVLGTIAAVAAGIFGLILIVGAFRQAWDADLGGMRTSLMEFGSSVGELWQDIIGFLTEEFTKFADFFQEKFVLIASFLSGATPEEAAATLGEAQAGGGVLGIEDSSLDAFTATLGAIADDTKEVFSGIGKTFEIGIDEIKDQALRLAKSLGIISPESKKTAAALGVVAGAAGMTESNIAQLGGAAGGVAEELEFDFLGGIKEAFAAIADDLNQVADRAELAAGVDEAFTKMAAEFDAVATGIGGVLKSAGSGIVNALGEAGELVNAAISGAAEGGIWGAIIAVIAELLTQVDEFTSISDRLNEFLKPLLEGFNDLLKGIKPLIDLDLGFIGTAFALIGAIFKTLGTALSFVVNFLIDVATEFVRFAQTLGVNVGTAIEDLQRTRIDVSVDDFTDTWDQFGDDVSKVWESGQKKAQDKIAEIVSDFGDAVPAGLADTLRGEEEAQRGFGLSLGAANRGLDDFSKGLGDANRKLLNVPTGFDIVAAVRSAAGVGASILGGGAEPTAAMAGGAVFTGNTFLISAEDPEEFFDRLEEIAEDRTFASSGAGVDEAAEFSLPQTTGQNV